jgi:hypothetical protein
MDNGEQDGRYLSYTTEQNIRLSGGPEARPSELRQGYLRFARFFDRMADDLGNKLMALNSLWDTHYCKSTRHPPFLVLSGPIWTADCLAP